MSNSLISNIRLSESSDFSTNRILDLETSDSPENNQTGSLIAKEAAPFEGHLVKQCTQQSPLSELQDLGQMQEDQSQYLALTGHCIKQTIQSYTTYFKSLISNFYKHTMPTAQTSLKDIETSVSSIVVSSAKKAAEIVTETSKKGFELSTSAAGVLLGNMQKAAPYLALNLLQATEKTFSEADRLLSSQEFSDLIRDLRKAGVTVYFDGKEVVYKVGDKIYQNLPSLVGKFCFLGVGYTVTGGALVIDLSTKLINVISPGSVPVINYQDITHNQTVIEVNHAIGNAAKFVGENSTKFLLYMSKNVLNGGISAAEFLAQGTEHLILQYGPSIKQKMEVFCNEQAHALEQFLEAKITANQVIA